MDKLEILKKYYGYDKLKKEQSIIVDNVLENKDIIGLLPTGYGKSITFQIPALLLDGITIVITPLIALMEDQVSSLKNKCIMAEYINSLQTKEEQDRIYRRLSRGDIKILYVSAERLESKKFLDIILSIDVSLVVADEAHTLLWSEDFRVALGHIPEFIKKLNKRPKMMALTATATNHTIDKIIKLLDLKEPKIVVCDCDRFNIFYEIKNSKNKDKDLLKYINNKDRAIIYCLTIRNVIHVYEYLNQLGYSVTYYYGALDSKIKKENQESYSRKEKRIMVSTNAFGMGIDIPDIRNVILYDMPQSIEDFSQQTGRGSRDGKFAKAILLFNLKDIDMNRYFIDNIDENTKDVRRIKRERYQMLDEMISLCIGSKCIHQKVVNYFGLPHKGHCNMCSNCTKKRGIKPL